MRVLMRKISLVPQARALLELLDDVRVRVEHALAAEQLDGIQKMPGGADGRENLEAVLLARVEVVGAMAGRRVDDTGARFERHIGAEHAERIAIKKRMAEPDELQLLAFIFATILSKLRPVASATFGASASATITARPSMS